MWEQFRSRLSRRESMSCCQINLPTRWLAGASKEGASARACLAKQRGCCAGRRGRCCCGARADAAEKGLQGARVRS